MTTFPIVIGCRRSGISLLKVMCASHPDVAVVPDASFAIRLAPRFTNRSDTTTTSFDARAFLDAAYADRTLATWLVARADAEASFQLDAPDTYSDAVQRLYQLWTDSQHKTRFVEASPDSIDHLSSLTQMFPDAKVIHLVRDGRHVAASLLELGLVSRLEDGAMHWRRQVSNARRILLSQPTGRHYELRYEDLVSAPEPTLQAMCRAIGLPYHPDMLDYRPLASQTVHRASKPHHHRFLAHPLRVGLRDWQRDLPTEAVERFEALAGGLLRELGYELQRPRPRVRAQLSARTHRRGWRRRLRARRSDAWSAGRDDHGLVLSPSPGRRPPAR